MLWQIVQRSFRPENIDSALGFLRVETARDRFFSEKGFCFSFFPLCSANNKQWTRSHILLPKKSICMNRGWCRVARGGLSAVFFRASSGCTESAVSVYLTMSQCLSVLVGPARESEVYLERCQMTKKTIAHITPIRPLPSDSAPWGSINKAATRGGDESHLNFKKYPKTPRQRNPRERGQWRAQVFQWWTTYLTF